MDPGISWSPGTPPIAPNNLHLVFCVFPGQSLTKSVVDTQLQPWIRWSSYVLCPSSLSHHPFRPPTHHANDSCNTHALHTNERACNTRTHTADTHTHTHITHTHTSHKAYKRITRRHNTSYTLTRVYPRQERHNRNVRTLVSIRKSKLGFSLNLCQRQIPFPGPLEPQTTFCSPL